MRIFFENMSDYSFSALLKFIGISKNKLVFLISLVKIFILV